MIRSTAPDRTHMRISPSVPTSYSTSLSTFYLAGQTKEKNIAETSKTNLRNLATSVESTYEIIYHILLLYMGNSQ